MQSELLNKTETASLLRVSVRTLDTRLKEGSGPQTTRIGRRVFVRASEIARYLEQQTQAER